MNCALPGVIHICLETIFAPTASDCDLSRAERPNGDADDGQGSKTLEQGNAETEAGKGQARRSAAVQEHAAARLALMNLLAMIFRPAVADAEIRAEIWRLGVRHVGWPLRGALDELREPNLPMGRTALLRACVERMKRDDKARPDPSS